MKYLFNILVGLTQLLNTILGGDPDETTSSRAWRNREKPFWKQFRIFIEFSAWKRSLLQFLFSRAS
jgi:hypothetical protein